MDQKKDAYFTPQKATAVDTAALVKALYNECSTGDGVSFSSFCHLLAHQRLLSFDFDHLAVLETFRQQTGGSFEDEATLDAKELRQALQALAVAFYGANYGLKEERPSLKGGPEDTPSRSFGMEALYKNQALQELLRDMNMRNVDAPFKLRNASARRTAFLEEELLEAAYEFQHALRELFLIYESRAAGGVVEARLQRSINGRSLYRLARGIRLVPDCMAPEHFHDLVRELYVCSSAKEKSYFEDMRMLQNDEEPDPTWLQPAPNEPNEPRFSFPEVLEIFVLAALEGADDRLERLHEVFQHLQLPVGEAPFDAQHFLEVVSGFLDDPNDREPANLLEIWAVLDPELPVLAPQKEPYIPQPPAHVAETLPPQPLSADQRVDENQRKNPFGRAGPLKKGKKKKVKVKRTKWREYFYGAEMARNVRWDQVMWLGKRPMPPKPEIPPVWQTDSKMTELQNLDDHIRKHRDESTLANAPASGWVLRLQLIDEPLRAPKCSSEEVCTLMETALTSRRLKQYEGAMALLIRARKLWATMEATGVAPDEWQDVQTLMLAPSPWGGSPPGTYQRQMPSEVEDASEEAETEDGGPVVKSQTEPRPPMALRPALQKSKTDGLGRLGAKSEEVEGDQGDRGDRGDRGPSRRYNPKYDFATALGDEDTEHLPEEAAVFFFCELASLHSALQEDELSGLLLWKAVACCRRLPRNDANAAMVWSGLGRVAFYSGSYEAAARLYMRARGIREKALGGDTVDTATSYNNLACCLAALDRPVEASAFIELSVEILKELAGEDHPRTHTALRNLTKVRSAPKKMSYEAPLLYSLPIHDFTRNLLTGKKKKKKGRSKSGSSRSSKSRK